ncbi:MAG: LppX_LprAFG lipoprotein [Acidimicrobiia bacterium]|nr:LppX_LprAFG lipoprotein [Acidimicrobiia bacterium]
MDDDQLLAALRDADPVDPTSLPAPTDPSARALLEQIVSTPRAFESPLPHKSYVVPPKRGNWKRRAALLTGSVAAAGALVFGLVATPFGSQPSASAAEAVLAAADATSVATADTVRTSTRFEVGGLPAILGTERVSGQVDVAFAGTDFGATVTFDQKLDGMAGMLLDQFGAGDGPIEVRLVDGVVYQRDATGWASYDGETDQASGETFVEAMRGRALLAALADVGDVAEVGRDDIDGVSTVHYRGTIDDPASKAQALEGMGALTGVGEPGTQLTVNVWVTDADLIRRVTVDGTLVAGGFADIERDLTVRTQTDFTDAGAPIAIEAPPADQVHPFQGFGAGR